MVEIDNYTFKFAEDGSINDLKYNGNTYADEAHCLAKWSYTQFGAEDYARFFNQYIRCDDHHRFVRLNHVVYSDKFIHYFSHAYPPSQISFEQTAQRTKRARIFSRYVKQLVFTR